MTQLVARVDDEYMEAIDELIAEGVVASRSDAVRRGLQLLIEESRGRRMADSIIRGYQSIPQAEEEWGWADVATVRMITDEPW